jgi:hypothetical protein
MQCVEFHVRWDPCPHSMARPRVADGGWILWINEPSYGIWI